MYLTQTNTIRGLTKSQYRQLARMCRFSNNLYNVALYNIRQYYFRNKKYLSYESNYHVCKDNENYQLLQAGVSQQTLKVVERVFRIFYNSVKKTHSGDYRFQYIRIPGYRRRGGMFDLVLPASAINVQNGYLQMPLSREFKRQHPDCDIRIPFPQRLSDKNIKEVRIMPIAGGKIFKIQYVYQVDESPADVDPDEYLAIDLGINNLASCISTLGTSFIIDGRKLKSFNQEWNKQKARLSAIAEKQGIRHTYRLSMITERRRNRMLDVMRKAARYIIDYCIENRIGSLVVGYPPDFKRNMNAELMDGRGYTNISFGDLRRNLQDQCERYGIRYIEQEESYTSQSSFLDSDALPDYRPEQPFKGHFKGERIYRGLYRIADGRTVNADVNAAANILLKALRSTKGKQEFLREQLRSGLLASPRRIRLV